MAKELYTKVTIGDRTFSIKKFDAMTGLQVARLVISKAAPIIPALDGNFDAGSLYKLIGEVTAALTDEDIKLLASKCLSVCYEVLPAGLAQVVDEHGNYGVDDIEYDMVLVLRLCFESIKWGAADFFTGNGFSSIPEMPRIG